MVAKCSLILLIALPAVAASECIGECQSSEQDALLLQVDAEKPHAQNRQHSHKIPHAKKHAKKAVSLTALFGASDPDSDSFGNKDCPCIAIDGVEGVNLFPWNKTYTNKYPADAGGSCKPWDKDLSPGCRDGEDPDGKNTWCANSWCYVDPCNCNLETPPKLSLAGGAKFQGKSLFFSYSTCGSEDSWTSTNHKTACVNQQDEDSCKENKKCAWTTPGKKFGKCLGKELVSACDTKADASVYGKEGCECIGIANRNGTVHVDVGDNTMVDYPISIGSTCTAWDDDTNPECKGDKAPAWCKEKWCYVDPCTCAGTKVPPKKSVYVEKAKSGGHPVYYSYDTCGEKDSWTEANNKKACPNQKDESSCGGVDGCSWTGKVCLKTELADACGIEFKSAAWKPVLALPALLALAMGMTA
jgi:hypothetical protein